MRFALQRASAAGGFGLCLTLAVALVVALAATAAEAQNAPLEKSSGLGGGLFGGGAGGDDDAKITVAAKVLPGHDQQPARLQLTATMQKGWHTYSITQPPGGPIKTKIIVNPANGLKVGAFKATTAPTKHPDPAFDGLIVEEHSGTAVWEAPISVEPGSEHGSELGPLLIAGAVRAQACRASCIPPTNYKFAVTLDAETRAAIASAPVPAELQGDLKLPSSPRSASGSQAGDSRTSGGTKARGGDVAESDHASNGAKGSDGSNGSSDDESPTRNAAELWPGAAAEYRGLGSHLTLRGRVTPGVAAPGDKVRLVLSITPDPPFHAYSLAKQDDGTIGRGKPTLIKLLDAPGLRFGEPEASVPSISYPGPDAPKNVDQYYSGAVDFAIEATIDREAKPGKHPIEGVISYQTCTLGKKDDAQCDLPTGARFHAMLEIAGPRTGEQAATAKQAAGAVETKNAEQAEHVAGDEQLVFLPAKYNQSPDDPRVPKQDGDEHESVRARLVELNGGQPESSLLFILLSSFVGGLILNLMPCVLPVIGLKLLSFVGQAGESRSRILTLNLWYVAGLFTVFACLATLASAASLKLGKANLGWGEHFSSANFNISMCALVFVMALSFIGVWEIPIPSFIGGGKGAELAAKEGPAGAYFKGVLSTLLATPCSGPFLGTVFAFTLKEKPAITYLVFGFLALGMGSPYLIIGAFPKLIRWLPKPGAWMDVFKQAMGFTLLGTVVYLLTFLHADYRMATLALLLGLGTACWWIGRTPLYEPLEKRLRAWAIGIALAAVIGTVGFRALVDEPVHRLPWQPFTLDGPGELAASGKTVMVDFTANWCPTCKVNLRLAIDTRAVSKLVKDNGVVPLKGDWSDGSQEIKTALERLDSNSIPILAIYPAGKPDVVLVLRDLISEGQVLEALERAGPSFDRENMADVESDSRLSTTDAEPKQNAR